MSTDDPTNSQDDLLVGVVKLSEDSRRWKRRILAVLISVGEDGPFTAVSTLALLITSLVASERFAGAVAGMILLGLELALWRDQSREDGGYNGDSGQ